MQEFDFKEPIDMLEFMLGVQFYTGNAVMNSIDGSPVMNAEIYDDALFLENTGETKKVNDYARMLAPEKVSRRNMQGAKKIPDCLCSREFLYLHKYYFLFFFPAVFGLGAEDVVDFTAGAEASSGSLLPLSRKP